MKPVIRQINYSEIPLLVDFPPKEWNTDLPRFLERHYGQDYFHAVVAEQDGKIVGFGNVILNGAAGWLGNILVPPNYRRQGIGTQITRYLMDFLAQMGCTSVLLIATPLGEGIYKKLGFVTSANYVFYRGEKTSAGRPIDHIRRLQAEDIPQLIEIDRDVSGEMRGSFLQQFFENGWVSFGDSPQQIEGFFLPEFGNGLIIARNSAAGINLLEYKISLGATSVIIPSANIAARELLIQHGFSQYATAPRMVFGRELDWKPDLIFSRAAGYCG